MISRASAETGLRVAYNSRHSRGIWTEGGVCENAGVVSPRGAERSRRAGESAERSDRGRESQTDGRAGRDRDARAELCVWLKAIMCFGLRCV